MIVLVRALSCFFALAMLLAATTPFAHADDLNMAAPAAVQANTHDTHGHHHSGRADLAESLHCGAHLLALNDATPDFAAHSDRFPALPRARQPAGTILAFEPPPPRT